MIYISFNKSVYIIDIKLRKKIREIWIQILKLTLLQVMRKSMLHGHFRCVTTIAQKE